VFKQYFDVRSQEAIRKYRGQANRKAALAMTGLLAGSVIGAGMFLFGAANVVEPAFIGAVSATVISEYHESKP
jgi:hypothetical protein